MLGLVDDCIPIYGQNNNKEFLPIFLQTESQKWHSIGNMNMTQCWQHDTVQKISLEVIYYAIRTVWR